MKFKKFKRKDQCRSLLIEGPKILKKHEDFFNEIKQGLSEEKYGDWEETAVFFLFLKPDLDLNELRPDRIDDYSSSVLISPKST